MQKYQVSIQSGSFALAAWLLIALPPRSIQEWLPPNRYEFGLPRVCVPYTPGTDVVSLVPDLFSAVTIICLCLLLSEIAKTTIAALPGKRIHIYVLFLLYQTTLAIDALRKYAWDWYGYLLYFARLIELRYDRPQPEILPLSSPWLSLVALLLCMSMTVIDIRGPRPRQEIGESPRGRSTASTG